MLSPPTSTSVESPLDGRLAPFSARVDETVPPSSSNAASSDVSWLTWLRYSDAVVVEAVSDELSDR